MTDKSDKDTNQVDKLANIVTTMILSAGTGISAHYVMAKELRSVAITIAVTAVSSIFVKPFLEGVSGRWKPKAK